jgi:hypothetical protein
LVERLPPTGIGVKHHADDLFRAPLDQPQIDFDNEGGETYICGNPPYVGDKYQTKDHKDDLKILAAKDVRAVDYIAGWFWKASDYIRLHINRYSLNVWLSPTTLRNEEGASRFS